MTTLTIPRDRIRRDIRPGDRIIAVDQWAHDFIVHPDPFRQEGAIRLINPLNTETIWNLYPDTQVGQNIVVVRDEDLGPVPEPAAVEAEPVPAPVEPPSLKHLVDEPETPEQYDADVERIAQEMAREDEAAALTGAERVSRMVDSLAQPEPTIQERLRAARAVLADLPPMDDAEKRHVRHWWGYVEAVMVLSRDGRDTDLRSIYSTTHNDRGQPTINRRYSRAGMQSHILGQVAAHHGWCAKVAPYTYRLTTAGRAAIAYAVVEPYDTAEARIEALRKAVYTGASNPGLIKRAEKIADTLEALGEPPLAARLRTALTTRWESLGARAERLSAILDDLKVVSR